MGEQAGITTAKEAADDELILAFGRLQGAANRDWAAHDDTYITDGENVVVLARYTAANKTTGNRALA